ncbi:MAG: hypothetical protein JEZ02_11160 [Desulfatibacillum sp.]|nr:hypothetical protein [Desulfatibacillum sp.]
MIKKAFVFLLCLGALTIGYYLFDFHRSYNMAANETGGEAIHLQDRCSRTRDFETGVSTGPWYKTITPHEAYNSERTHTFPVSCSLEEIANLDKPKIVTRSMAGLPGIYNVVTRDRDELFALGGTSLPTDDCEEDGPDCATGPFVAKIDPHTLRVLWRTQFHNAQKDGDWDYPGAIGVHGNGFVYAVAGHHMVKVDPSTGEVIKKVKLPTPAGRVPGDTVYNGFSILSDGRLIAKSMTRKEGSKKDSIVALLFHYDKDTPSIIAVVDPESLAVVSSVEVREPVLGRISNGVFNRADYIYVSGFKNVFRYRYANGKIVLDENWGPVRYCDDDQKPATAPAVFGDFIIVQTNFQIAGGPLTLTAVTQADDTKVFRISPYEEDGLLPGSLQWSLPTVDVENSRIYTYDFLEGKLAALDFDMEKGFSIAWKVNQRSLSFASLTGPKEHRTLVLDDSNLPSLATVKVIYRDANTGKKLAKSGAIPLGSGLPVTPGFDGVFYYPSANGMLTEIRIDSE